MDRIEYTSNGCRRVGIMNTTLFEVSKENKELRELVDNLSTDLSIETNKLLKIEQYLDRQPDIPIEVVINIKNIIHNDVEREE